MFKQLIVTAVLLGTAFSHGAADNTSALVAPVSVETTAPESNLLPEYIGFTHTKKGWCVIQAPLQANPEEDCPITVIYSELAHLNDPHVSVEIAKKLSQHNKSASFSQEHFNKALSDIVREYKMYQPANVSIAFIPLAALWVNISKTGIKSYSRRRVLIDPVTEEDRTSYRREVQFFEFNKITKDHRNASTVGIYVNEHRLNESPYLTHSYAQDLAEKADFNDGEVALCLVIDIKKWLAPRGNAC